MRCRVCERPPAGCVCVCVGLCIHFTLADIHRQRIIACFIGHRQTNTQTRENLVHASECARARAIIKMIYSKWPQNGPVARSPSPSISIVIASRERSHRYIICIDICSRRIEYGGRCVCFVCAFDCLISTPMGMVVGSLVLRIPFYIPHLITCNPCWIVLALEMCSKMGTESIRQFENMVCFKFMHK